MPPQLRSSRAMPSSPVGDDNDNAHHGSSSASISYHRHCHGRPTSPANVISPSRSYEDVANLSSQSLRSALHPPHSVTSPSKTHAKYQGGMGGGQQQQHPNNKAMSSKFMPINGVIARRRRMIFCFASSLERRMSANVKYSSILFAFATMTTMFALGTLRGNRTTSNVVATGAALKSGVVRGGGIGIGNGIDAHRGDAVRAATGVGGRGWNDAHRTALAGNLRKLRDGGGHHHPRVVDVASMHKSMILRGGKRDDDDPSRTSRSSVLSNVDAAMDEEAVDGDGVVVVVEAGDATDDEDDEDEDGSKCVPMATWQTTSYPNCNTVHEIDMVRSSGMGSYAFPNHWQEDYRRSITSHPSILHEYLNDLHLRYPTKRKRNAKSNAMGLMKEESIEFLGQGWFRSAWEMYVEEIPDYDEDEETWGFEESVVLKTLRIERDFLPEYYELHRRDALAMERLTFSPYVLDIYGYCGQSAINELANFGIEGMSSLEKIARSFRGMDSIEPVSKIKLQLASRVAAGVSHVHGIDHPDFPISVEVDDDSDDGADGRYDDRRRERTALLRDIADGKVKVTSNATLVHYDLNPRNIAVVKRGKPKLNDFNVAELMTWDARNNRTCGFSGRFREPWWRAPEEMHFHMPNHTDPAPLTEKIDIYSLGNILMEILTTHSPWGLMQKGEAEEETRPKVARGELPEWPDDFNQTKLITDPALKAIHSAMMKCLRFNPKDRPTAGEVAAELFEAIDNLPEGFGDKEKWRREREIEDGRIDEREKMEENEEVIGEGYIDKEKWKRKREMKDNRFGGRR